MGSRYRRGVHQRNHPIKGAASPAVPLALQGYTVYAAAIPKASTDPTAARAFIDALVSPPWRGAGPRRV